MSISKITRSLSRKMADIITNLKLIREKINHVVGKRDLGSESRQPRLVAVSKLKPPEAIIQAYEAGQIHFGENYVGELETKANSSEILEKCKNIQWHFIGHLQKNKINKLLRVPNLYLIETVDSEKLATTIDNSWEKSRKNEEKLKIMVQVNTSKEKEKSGCAIEELVPLVNHIKNNCKNLEFVGLMTIGMYGYDATNEPNPDFISLKNCRTELCKKLNLNEEEVELSMGMSSDYEHAIELGSTNVRVGSSIFGERLPKNF